jgi:pimeloyl-ACP methyl ester carboxylesterase
MKKYIFIHGACQGSWCWTRVTGILSSRGSDCVAPDLPGRENDPTPHGELTFDRYVDAIRSIVAASDGTCVLVGHSMGGFVASRVAGIEHDRIGGIVYVAALVPRNGESIAQMLATDRASDLMRSVSTSPDRASVVIDPARSAEVMFNRCSADDAAFGTSMICTEAIVPMRSPVTLTDRFESIGKYYVKTAYDRALSPAYQDELRCRYGGIETFGLDAGHAPYFSHARELADAIESLTG